MKVASWGSVCSVNAVSPYLSAELLYHKSCNDLIVTVYCCRKDLLQKPCLYCIIYYAPSIHNTHQTRCDKYKIRWYLATCFGRDRPSSCSQISPNFVIITSCLDVCCVLTVYNILYKFDNTQLDGLSQKN